MLGDAHRIFEKHARMVKADKKKPAKSLNLNKPALHQLMQQMVNEQRLRFVTKQKMHAFVEENFGKYDVNNNGYLSLEEFTQLYREFLTADPEEVLKRLQNTEDELERIFVLFDADGSFELAQSELVSLMRSKEPKGFPPPAEEKLIEIASEVLKSFDKDQSGSLDFDEFKEAYNAMIEKLGELHAEIRDLLLAGSNFSGLVSQGSWTMDYEEAELEELERITATRYDGPVWFARIEELMNKAADGNTLERARKAGKLPICLKHPEQYLDDVAQYFSSKGCKMLDLQEMGMQLAAKEMESAEAAGLIRDALVEAWADGVVLVMRYGSAALDLMLELSIKDVLPCDIWTAANMSPGKLSADTKKILRKQDGDPERFAIREGFHLVLTSCFSMHNWKDYFRGRLPIGEVQPVQMCRSIQQVADVMRNPALIPKDTMSDDLDAMDRLADML